MFEILEIDLKYSHYKDLIINYFSITLNISYSLLCGHKFSKEEKVLALELDIHNSNNLNTALNSFFLLEYMSKDNTIYCSECLNYSDGHRLTKIINLPKILIIVLKRFIYDKKTNTKIKSNKYLEFPFYLDLSDYVNFNETNVLFKNTKYNLKDVIIHKGNIEFGHYFILINDCILQKWIKLNDKLIDFFDIETLRSVAFGGYDNYYKNEIDSNAYMLVYENINEDDKRAKNFNIFKNPIVSLYNNKSYKFENKIPDEINTLENIIIGRDNSSEESFDDSYGDYSINYNMENLVKKFDNINIENRKETKKNYVCNNNIDDNLNNNFKPNKRKHDNSEDSKKKVKSKEKGKKKKLKCYNYPKDK